MGFICLFAMVTMLQKMLLGTSTRIIYKATNINGYLAMLIGVGVTILVQSSSITTSTFTPLVGMGVIRLEQMYPITLGANIGTTITALLAALLSTTEAMQVALAHLFFNISGIIVWYPIPLMRRIPLNAARQLGRATRLWRGIPLVYILICFFVIPLLLLGISLLFTEGVKGFIVLGSMICACLFAGILYGIWYWRFNGGKQKCITCMTQRQARTQAMQTLPQDMESVMSKIKKLEEHTGLLSEEDLTDDEKVVVDDEKDKELKSEEIIERVDSDDV